MYLIFELAVSRRELDNPLKCCGYTHTHKKSARKIESITMSDTHTYTQTTIGASINENNKNGHLD